MSVTRVVVEEGTEEALIAKAKAYRAKETPFWEAERAMTRESTRRAAEGMGVHRAGPDGRIRTELPQRFTIDDTVAGSHGDGVRIGGMVMRRGVAQSAGLVGEDGRLTAKGAALAKRDGGPAETARPAAQPARVTAEELDEHRQGDDFEGDTEDELDDEIATPTSGPTGELAQSVESLLEAGQFADAVDAAEPVIGELNGSASYQSAVEAYLGGENPTAAMVAGIAQDLGISTADAAERVDVAMAGFQAEAAASVAEILTPEQAESFVDYLTEHRQDVFNRAAEIHVKRGSLVGWTSAAREFAESVRGINPEDFAGRHSVGGEVYEEGGRWWFARNGRTVDLLAAIAAGVVRPA